MALLSPSVGTRGEVVPLNDNDLLRYSRHILLNEFGVEGQQKLAESRALVIGAGGLGRQRCYISHRQA